MRFRSTALLFGILGVAAIVFWLTGRREREGGIASPAGPDGARTEIRADMPPVAYVGREACVGCHPVETGLWQGSHHDLAMDVATKETVRARFDGSTLAHGEETSTFLSRDGKFLVRTTGADGEMSEYEVAYVFGATPLQQYLVGFPGGRYQTLTTCWDTRPEADGGQKWFHLYGDERIPPGDPLHWTSPSFVWNSMCAECHSTGLVRGYKGEEDRFETTWSEIDVSCEACHGPGEGHVEWARKTWDGSADPGEMGLLFRLGDHDDGRWVTDIETGLSRREPPRTHRVEIDVCASCHARRSSLRDPTPPGAPFLDAYRPALLDEGLYHPDGQILDEVYVWGSFVQSKMYREGVTCSDCHDAHSGRVRGVGNTVCAGCHLPAKFDTPTHHFHEPGTRGALCVECHMPEKTYMVVDPRRDHSLRVPRPDLTAKIGTPNACNGCHQDRDAAWARAAVAGWYGEKEREPHYGEAIEMGREGAPGAFPELSHLVANGASPGIARATALSMLGRWGGPESFKVIREGLTSPDPLLRLGALQGLSGWASSALGATSLIEAVSPLLDDRHLAVRMEAARILAPLRASLPAGPRREAVERGIGAYIEAQLARGETAEAHLNLGSLLLDLGDVQVAESAYRTAIRRNPSFAPAYLNLADLLRAAERDAEGETVLRDGLRRALPRDALHFSLAMLLVRGERLDEAIVELERATDENPTGLRYALALALTLEKNGDREGALAILRDAHVRMPHDIEVLRVLLARAMERGDSPRALDYARKLLALEPGDGDVRAVVERLGG
jgi:tetratricopeptide (TPR) repeat protein